MISRLNKIRKIAFNLGFYVSGFVRPVNIFVPLRFGDSTPIISIRHAIDTCQGYTGNVAFMPTIYSHSNLLYFIEDYTKFVPRMDFDLLDDDTLLKFLIGIYEDLITHDITTRHTHSNTP